jgi:hypothetical protein
VHRFGINRSEVISWMTQTLLNVCWLEEICTSLQSKQIGMVIANSLGTRFLFENNVRLSLLAAKNWMMYGINPHLISYFLMNSQNKSIQVTVYKFSRSCAEKRILQIQKERKNNLLACQIASTAQ